MRILPALPLAVAFICILHVSKAQETLVDVPSLEIVESKKLFFQEQGVFSKEGINTSTTLALGLGKDWEMGVFVYQLVFQRSKGLEIDTATPEDNPDFLLTSQKAFAVTPWLKLGAGMRAGLSAARSNQHVRFVTFDYVTSQFTIGEAGHQIIAGAYYADHAYASIGKNYGAMGGINLNILHDKVHLIADFLTGDSSIGTISSAIEVTLPKQWKISAGVQFPFTGSSNEQGAVLQVTKN